MKLNNNSEITLLLLILFSAACNNKVDRYKKVSDTIIVKTATAVNQPQPGEFITGDFNADGKKEQASVIRPAFNKDSTDCNGDCITIIRFSDTMIPSIEINDAVSADLNNLGDLNKNGSDELGFLPGSFAGCWNDYHVYTFINNQWMDAVKPFPVYCSQWDEGMPPVKSDSAKKGYAVITYSVNTGEEIITKKRSVPVKQN